MVAVTITPGERTTTMANKIVYLVTELNTLIPFRAVDINGDETEFALATSTQGSGASAPSSSPVTIATPTAVTVPVQIIKTVAATGTPEAIAANNTFFQSATIIGKKAARTNNTGNVYLGIGVTNDSQIVEIIPGAMISLEAPIDQKYDLNDFGVDVLNAGDGVAVMYS